MGEIKQEMQNEAFRVRVEWMEFEEFMEHYGDGVSVLLNGQKQKLATNSSNGQDTGTNWRSGHDPWNNTNWHSGQDTWNDADWRGGQDTGNSNTVDNNTNWRSGQDGGGGDHAKTKSKVGKGQDDARKQDGKGATKSGTVENKAGKGGGKSGKGKSITEKGGGKGKSVKTQPSSEKTSSKVVQNPTLQDIFLCDACGRSFASDVALRQHWQSKPECAGGRVVATSPQQQEGTINTRTKTGSAREAPMINEQQPNKGKNKSSATKKKAARDPQSSEKDSSERVGKPGDHDIFQCHTCGRSFASDVALCQHWLFKPECAGDAGVATSRQQEKISTSTTTSTRPASEEAVTDEKQANKRKDKVSVATGALQQHWKSRPECMGEPRVATSLQQQAIVTDQSCFSSSPQDISADALFAALLDALEVVSGDPWSDAVERALFTCARFGQCSQTEILANLEEAALDPGELLGRMQRCVDKVYGLLFQWACVLRRQGATFDLNKGERIVLACDCGARGQEFKNAGDYFVCNVCGATRSWVRVIFVKDAPAETVEAAGVLDCQFKIALANLGMLPTVRHSWCPFLVVAAAAQCSFMEELGGTPFPPLLPGLASAIPSQGPLRDLDDLAFDVASACETDDAAEVSCKLCFRRFPSMSSLQRHSSFDHSQEAVNFLFPALKKKG